MTLLPPLKQLSNDDMIYVYYYILLYIMYVYNIVYSSDARTVVCGRLHGGTWKAVHNGQFKENVLI